MSDINIEFAGLEMQSPFLLASGPEGISIGRIRDKASKIAENRWGAVVTKTMVSYSHPPVRPYLWTTKRLRRLGMQNLGPAMVVYSEDKVAELKEDIAEAHKVGLKIIVSLIGSTLSDYEEKARRMEEIEADAIELNLSCPGRFKALTEESLGGMRIGQSPEATREVVEAVKRTCDIPVIPKLTAHAYDIAHVASACQEAGADAISIINTIRGIIGVDIDSGIPVPSDIYGNAHISGISGPLIRPFGLMNVALVALNTDLSISGIGGVEDHSSAIEFFLLGASTVQVCTAAMWKGLVLGRQMAVGLTEYMEDKGYSSVKDFVGKSLGYIRTEPEGSPPINAVIDYEFCTDCGRCYIACNDMAYEAIQKVDKRYRVDEAACGGCGLCYVVCPFDAVTYREK